ncbi:MAG TPA: ROK family transcriptional regulator [Clostridia bacterium]
MFDKLTGNNRYLKELNQAAVMELIRINGKLSRKELSDLTGLSPTACGSITRKLIHDGFLHETGQGESTGGRKPVMLEIKPDSYYAAGFDIGITQLQTAVADISGRVLAEKSIEYELGISVEGAVLLADKQLNEIIHERKLNRNKFLGCAFSVPGLVDRSTDKIVMAPNLSWNHVDLSTKAAEILNMPVYIENEAMCSAICEHWIGKCRNIGNFVCINVESGIGAGIFINGALFRGAGGSAGEIGHLVVDENGRACGCGNYGCLETYASVWHMLQRANERIREGYSSEYVEPEKMIEWNELIEYARKGDSMCLDILRDGAKFLGYAAAYIINTLNPEAVVIGKCFNQYSSLVLDVLIETAMKKALPYPASKAVITVSDYGMNSSALGAAMIPIRKVFGQ